MNKVIKLEEIMDSPETIKEVSDRTIQKLIKTCDKQIEVSMQYTREMYSLGQRDQVRRYEGITEMYRGYMTKLCHEVIRREDGKEVAFALADLMPKGKVYM